MESVRDRGINDWEMILDGRMKGDTAIVVRQLIKDFNPEQVAIMKRLLPGIVDQCLHHLLWTLEQVDHVKVAVETEKGQVEDLKNVSDGLAGDLYDWIPQFSRFPRLK